MIQPLFQTAATGSSTVKRNGHLLDVRRSLRIAFSLFVFSIIFETAVMGFPVKLTHVTGAALLLSALVQPRVCFRPPPAAFWLFGLYILACVTSTLIAGTGRPAEVFQQLFVVSQLLVMFWIACNLFQDLRCARSALMAFVLSCAVMAALQLSGIAARPVDAGSRAVRMSAFGADINNLAGMFGLGILMTAGMAFAARPRLLRPFAVGIPVLILLGTAIVWTGSRGGLVALGAGMLALAVHGANTTERIRNALTILTAMAVLGAIAVNSDTVRHRFTDAMSRGHLSDREKIYPVAWRMFTERPVLGWGAADNAFEMGAHMRSIYHQPRRETHNLLLYLLTASGIVGAVPFLIGVLMSVRAGWLARSGPYGLVPFALVAFTLVADMSVDGLHWKQHWLVLAFAFASARQVSRARLQEAAPVKRLSSRTPRNETDVLTIAI